MAGKKSKYDIKELKRWNLYVRPEQKKAAQIMAAVEEKNEYDIVIEALDKHIPKKYFDMAQEKK